MMAIKVNRMSPSILLCLPIVIVIFIFRFGLTPLCHHAGLNLARALGDKFVKGVQAGFSAQPYVSNVFRLTREGKGLVVVARYANLLSSVLRLANWACQKFSIHSIHASSNFSDCVCFSRPIREENDDLAENF